MSLKEIMKKLAVLDGVKGALSADELAELENIEDSKVEGDWDKKVKEANAKAARILDEKKKVQDKFEELAKQLDEIQSSGLSEVEKFKKDMLKVQEDKTRLEKELNDTKTQYSRQMRETKLDKILGKVRFLETIPQDMRLLSITTAFNEVEDLDDETAVNDALKRYVDSHKSVIESDSPKGSNSLQRNLGSSTTKKEPIDMSYDEREKILDAKVKNARQI